MELEPVAAELYGLPPDAFTTARNARAAEAKAGGDKAVAAAIGKLRKPTLAAYALNLLARHEQQGLQALLDLGDEMRAASAARDGAALRTLSKQRHQAFSALLAAATERSDDAGHPLADSARRDVEASLQAALTDPDCARDLLAGQLSGVLRADGLAAFGAAPAVAAPAERTVAAEKTSDQELRDAGEALQRAIESAARADEDAAAAADAQGSAEDSLAAATADVTALRTQLEAAEREQANAQRAAERASAALVDTTDAAAAAHDAEAAARRRVADLRG